MLDETDIQKLLHLKRHEQPPDGYYEKFLCDFHRRQRTEILRQPVWKLALERMGAFFSDRGAGRLAYAGATMAVLLFAGVASYKMLYPAISDPPSQNLAVVGNTPVPSQHIADNQDQLLHLYGNPDVQVPSPNLPELMTTQVADPHPVLDSRPVSYERSFSF